MENKCTFNPKNFVYLGHRERLPRIYAPVVYSGYRVPISVEKSEINITRRPVVQRIAAGLRVLERFFKPVTDAVTTYKRNIQHTYEHKIIFSLVEKELFGKNSIDSITHDADKLVMYLFGLPKSFVSRFHRKHSVHHTEYHQAHNLRSMLCDNIASCPEFKPEKKKGLREHFLTCPELQKIPGLRELLEKYNYGENIDFRKIKQLKSAKYQGTKGFIRGLAKIASLAILHHV